MAKSCCDSKANDLKVLREKQAGVLKIVLAINLAMFLVEFTAGWLSSSASLMADSLDMLGDAIVYGFSLYVLHRSETIRATAALLKGVIIVGFGLAVFAKALYTATAPGVPVAEMMGIVGAIALIANGSCLWLLTAHRNDDINMRSTWICSRNDIISNVGVLSAAFLVYQLNSKWPDVIVGLIIAIVFLRSSVPILSESIAAIRKNRSGLQHSTDKTS